MIAVNRDSSFLYWASEAGIDLSGWPLDRGADHEGAVGGHDPPGCCSQVIDHHLGSGSRRFDVSGPKASKDSLGDGDSIVSACCWSTLRANLHAHHCLRAAAAVAHY